MNSTHRNHFAIAAGKRGHLLLTVGLLFAIFALPAMGQVGGGFDLSWTSLDGGGSTSPSTGGIYGVAGTIGQADAGSMSGGVYGLTGGFWSTAASPSGVVTGHVTWQGIGQPSVYNTGITATLTLCVSGAPTSYTVTTDASGFFTVTTGLADNAYNYLIKRNLSLAGAGTFNISGGMASAELGIQGGGDANNNNVVDSQDFNILKQAFGNIDVRADFNNDGIVNAQDFNILRANFGTSGAALTCP